MPSGVAPLVRVVERSVEGFAVRVSTAPAFRNNPAEHGIVGADGRDLVVGVFPVHLRAVGRVVQIHAVIDAAKGRQSAERVIGDGAMANLSNAADACGVGSDAADYHNLPSSDVAAGRGVIDHDCVAVPESYFKSHVY